MQSGSAASVSDRWQTPSRIVFPHQLLNYSGQGFLQGDPGSSRQTDAVGPAGGLAGKLGIIAKNSQQPWLVLLVAAVKTGQFTGSITNKRGGDLAEPGAQGLPRSRRSRRSFMQNEWTDVAVFTPQSPAAAAAADAAARRLW